MKMTLAQYQKRTEKRVKAGSKVRANYYSVYIPEGDPNYASDVEILEHENGVGMCDQDLKEMGNHFATKREAKKARTAIVKTLRLLRN